MIGPIGRAAFGLAAIAASFLVAGCARNPAARHSDNAGVAGVASSAPVGGRLPCFAGLRAYRFAGQFSFDSGGGAGQQEIGSLANLLKDVRFDGAFRAPDATQVHVSFPGGSSQDLETVQIAGKHYQRVADGKWEAASANGGGPFISTLTALDPRTLCAQTLATVNIGSAQPVSESIGDSSARHYHFTGAELASSQGFFGRGREDGAAAPDTTLDVWIADRGGYPLRIMVRSGNQQQGGAFAITIDVNDRNGGDIRIRAPF